MAKKTEFRCPAELRWGRRFRLQVVLDLLDHGGVRFLAEVLAAGVHGEGRAPLELVGLVLGNQMEVQMAAAVAVGAVVDLVGMEGLVQGIGGLVHIGKIGIEIGRAHV